MSVYIWKVYKNQFLNLASISLNFAIILLTVGPNASKLTTFAKIKKYLLFKTCSICSTVYEKGIKWTNIMFLFSKFVSFMDVYIILRFWQIIQLELAADISILKILKNFFSSRYVIQSNLVKRVFCSILFFLFNKIYVFKQRPQKPRDISDKIKKSGVNTQAISKQDYQRKIDISDFMVQKSNT